MYTNTITIYMAQSPCFFISPCWIPFAPLSNPLHLLGTLLAVTGSVHLGLRLLVNWPPLSQPFPQSLPPPNSQNPGYQAPHYDDLMNPASSVRNSYIPSPLCAAHKIFRSFTSEWMFGHLWHYVHSLFKNLQTNWLHSNQKVLFT
jgi:hypothetical protein